MEVRLYAYLHKTATTQRMHLRVRQNVFDDALRERLHRIGSPARWDAEKWEWDYPLTSAAVVALHRAVAELKIAIDWADDLKEYAAEQKRIEDYEQSVRLAIEKIIQSKTPLPGYITDTMGGAKPPMFHQQVAYHWSLRTSGLYLAHDPGLGKTRSGCDALRGWYEAGIVRPMQQVWVPQQGRWGVRGGVLIVCPNWLQSVWRDEMMQWQRMTGLPIQGSSRAQKLLKAGMIAHAHIINYESLRVVLGNEYDGMVCDEAHKLSNFSGQTDNVLTLSQGTRRRLFLSGTPVSNNLESVFLPMLIVDGGRSLGSSKTAFIERWFETEIVGPGITKNVPKPKAVEEISAAMARCTYFLKKEEALPDLPAKTHTPIKLAMTDEQTKYYKALRDEAITYIQDATVTLDQAAARMMKLRQVCQGFVVDDDGKIKQFSSIKTDTVVDLLTDKLAHRKVVVWAVFTDEINRLCATLQQRQIGYVRMDGKVTSKKDREQAISLWNNEPRIKVFIGQIQLGVGLTLHANECQVPCYDCIYLGIDYSYINWKQSQDRIHRIGQKFHCNYTYLLTEDGIDWTIYRALQSKENTAAAVHKTGKEFFVSLLTGDVPDLAALN